MVDVAIVGGGITGLATAWFLRRNAPGLSVTLVESGDRLGGKIRTSEWLGVPVEAGPDTFLARVPPAVELCRQVGLGDDLVPPATGRAFVWTRGRLRELPEGHVLGVPGRLGPLVRSGIVSPRGLARAGLDLVFPRRPTGPDPSVAEVVGGRFGREVVDRLVDPLLGGIHAGSTDRLSLASVAPAVAEAAARSRSLLLGLRSGSRRPPGTAAGGDGDREPLFLSVRGGLGRLVDRLRERLDGVEVRTGTEARELRRTEPQRWRLSCSGDSAVDASSVVLTVPAFAAAGLLRAACPEAATQLDSIRYASVATVTFAYRTEDVRQLPDGSGFLVPAVDGRLMTACTFLTSKWPELARSGRVLVRASAGRATDERALRLDDQALAEQLHRELTEALALVGEPEDVAVVRWPRAFPQYEVGHRARVTRIEKALDEAAPGVAVAGAAYHGLGIAACVQQAEQVAMRAAEQVASRS